MRGRGPVKRAANLCSVSPRSILRGAVISAALIALLLTASRITFSQMHTDSLEARPREERNVHNNGALEEEVVHDLEIKSKLILGSNASSHALFRIPSGITTLEDTLLYLQQQAVCRESPIFVTMAAVGSDIYWQLIENFMYTMERFQLLSCSLMICVSDANCYKKCLQNRFPCFNYNHIPLQPAGSNLPSTMEQIAHLKLLHIPKALSKGVDVFTLDLDVGFYGNSCIFTTEH